MGVDSNARVTSRLLTFSMGIRLWQDLRMEVFACGPTLQNKYTDARITHIFDEFMIRIFKMR